MPKREVAHIPMIDMGPARKMCPLCALDIRRVPAMHAELYVHEFNIYTCAMWSDVNHVASAGDYAIESKISLVRAKRNGKES